MKLTTHRIKNLPTSIAFWVLSGFLIILVLTGGTSRSDEQSMILLRPVSFLACGLALLTLKKEHFDGRFLLFFGMLAVISINLIYLIPLPPEIWRNLPGHDDIKLVDSAVNLGGVWRPITIAPFDGWNSVAALVAPLAILLLGFQLNQKELWQLLFLLMGIAVLSGLLGMLQAINSNSSALYLYRIINTGSAVGIFANRNHAATLLACLFPMLAVFVTRSAIIESQIWRRNLAVAIAVMLVPIILITGSRSGLILAIIGLFGGVAILWTSGKVNSSTADKGKFKKAAMPMIAIVSLLSLSFVTFFLSRAEAVNRLFQGSLTEENRIGFWKMSVDLFWVYFPFGSGPGSFDQVYQLLEKTNSLNRFYLNHAHNDWIEIATTYGFPGAIFLVAVTVVFFIKNWKLWVSMDRKRSSVVFGRMAGVAIAILGIASVADYPLRTPTFMCVFAVLALWFGEAGGHRDLTKQSSERAR